MKAVIYSKIPNGQIATRRINKADVSLTIVWLEQAPGLPISNKQTHWAQQV